MPSRSRRRPLSRSWSQTGLSHSNSSSPPQMSLTSTSSRPWSARMRSTSAFTCIVLEVVRGHGDARPARLGDELRRSPRSSPALVLGQLGAGGAAGDVDGRARRAELASRCPAPPRGSPRRRAPLDLRAVYKQAFGYYYHARCPDRRPAPTKTCWMPPWRCCARDGSRSRRWHGERAVRRDPRAALRVQGRPAATGAAPRVGSPRRAHGRARRAADRRDRAPRRALGSVRRDRAVRREPDDPARGPARPGAAGARRGLGDGADRGAGRALRDGCGRAARRALAGRRHVVGVPAGSAGSTTTCARASADWSSSCQPAGDVRGRATRGRAGTPRRPTG